VNGANTIANTRNVIRWCCSDAHSVEWSDVRRFDSVTAWLHHEAARWSRNQGTV